MEDPKTFSDLMPDVEPKRKSLREFLSEERRRENRSSEHIQDMDKMIKRGGFGGQFNGNT